MKAGAALIVLALLCVALGYALGRGDGAGGDADGDPGYLATLTADLQLTPEQVSRLSRILADEERDLQRLAEQQRQALATSVDARLQRTEDAMLALLDDGQRARYRALTTAQR